MAGYKHYLKFSKDKYYLNPRTRYFWFSVKSEYPEWPESLNYLFQKKKKTDKQSKKLLFFNDKCLAFFLKKKAKNDYWNGALFSKEQPVDKKVGGFEFEIVKPIFNFDPEKKTYIFIIDDHVKFHSDDPDYSSALGFFFQEILELTHKTVKFFEKYEKNYEDMTTELLSDKFNIPLRFFQKVNRREFEKQVRFQRNYGDAESAWHGYENDPDPVLLWKMLAKYAEKNLYDFIILNNIPKENALKFLEENGNVILFSTQQKPAENVNVKVRVDIIYGF